MLTASAPFFIMRRLFSLAPLLFGLAVVASAQVATPTHGKPAAAPSAGGAEHAAALAESGHCAEVLPSLTRTAPHLTDRELQKRVGLDGVRCATLLQQQDSLLDLLRVLNQHFPHDPEVLYVTVHAYSDLSSNAARELEQTAPTSIPGLEMDAEANEVQSKWDQAEKDYRKILDENPRYPGFTFAWRGCCFPGPIPDPTSRTRPRKSCSRSWRSTQQMPAPNMCWANWPGKVRISPRPSGIL